MSSMTYKASIEQARPNPDSVTPSDADLRSVFYMLNDEDAARLTGGILRNAAFNKVALEFGDIEGFRNHAEFVGAWYEHARADDHDWSLVIPVAFTYGSGKTLWGGMKLTLACVKDREPRLHSFSLNQ